MAFLAQPLLDDVNQFFTLVVEQVGPRRVHVIDRKKNLLKLGDDNFSDARAAHPNMLVAFYWPYCSMIKITCMSMSCRLRLFETAL